MRDKNMLNLMGDAAFTARYPHHKKKSSGRSSS